LYDDKYSLIIGGGVVGQATDYRLSQKLSGKTIIIVEKSGPLPNTKLVETLGYFTLESITNLVH